MDLSEPDPTFSDSNINDDMTGSSNNEANDVTVKVFASSRKDLHVVLLVLKVASRHSRGVHHGSSSQKKKVSKHTVTIIIITFYLSVRHISKSIM